MGAELSPSPDVSTRQRKVVGFAVLPSLLHPHPQILIFRRELGWRAVAIRSVAMSGFEIAGLVIGVTTGIVPLLRKGHKIVVDYRRGRRFRLQSSGISPLADEIKRSESEIEERYAAFERSLGPAFAHGDGEWSSGHRYFRPLLSRADIN